MGNWGCNPTYTLHLDQSSGAFLFLPLSILKEHMPKVKSLKIIFPQSFKIFSQPWNPISFQFIQDILYQVGCTNQVLSPTWGLNNSMPGHHVVWFGSFQVGAFQKNGGWNYISTVFGWESCLLFKAKTFTTPGRFARIYIWNDWFSHANHASSNTKKHFGSLTLWDVGQRMTLQTSILRWVALFLTRILTKKNMQKSNVGHHLP